MQQESIKSLFVLNTGHKKTEWINTDLFKKIFETEFPKSTTKVLTGVFHGNNSRVRHIEL